MCYPVQLSSSNMVAPTSISRNMAISPWMVRLNPPPNRMPDNSDVPILSRLEKHLKVWTRSTTLRLPVTSLRNLREYLTRSWLGMLCQQQVAEDLLSPKLSQIQERHLMLQTLQLSGKHRMCPPLHQERHLMCPPLHQEKHLMLYLRRYLPQKLLKKLLLLHHLNRLLKSKPRKQPQQLSQNRQLPLRLQSPNPPLKRTRKSPRKWESTPKDRSLRRSRDLSPEAWPNSRLYKPMSPRSMRVSFLRIRSARSRVRELRRRLKRSVIKKKRR